MFLRGITKINLFRIQGVIFKSDDDVYLMKHKEGRSDQFLDALEGITTSHCMSLFVSIALKQNIPVLALSYAVIGRMPRE